MGKEDAYQDNRFIASAPRKDQEGSYEGKGSSCCNESQKNLNEEHVLPPHKSKKGTVWKVLVSDDEEMVHTMTRMVLASFLFEDIPVQLFHAYTGEETKKIMMEHPDMAVMLLDVVMEEDHSGLDVVRYVRKELKNDMVRIVLRTGQPGQAPEAKVIMEYDINDYREKTDLTVQKLNTALVTAIRGYRDIKRLKESERALMKAMEKVMEASRIKNRFMANMSHEIRTPLNGIIVTTDLLKTTPLNAEQLEYVNMLKASTERLLPIVNDILDLSRIESGNVRLEPKCFELREMLNQVIQGHKRAAQNKDLNLFWECDSSVPNSLVGDSERLSQVLSNLINNSIKFTHSGHVFVNCGLKSQTEGRVELIFIVEDTGIGIPEEELSRVFQPFIQGEAGIEAGRAGTGLGLAISKNLVEMMEGSIGVVSHPYEGTAFSFHVVLKTGD